MKTKLFLPLILPVLLLVLAACKEENPRTKENEEQLKPPSEENVKISLSLDNLESIDGWQSPGNTLTLDQTDKKEGNTSLKSEGASTGRFIRTFSPFNVTIDTDRAYLCFSLYVSDISKLTGAGQIEISSSGTADLNETAWAVNSVGLRNGWNNIVLKLSAGSNTGGLTNFSAINFFRLYANSKNGETVVLKIDNMRFTDFYNNGNTADPNFHIYILAGQSNMAGYGYMSDIHPNLNIKYSEISNDRVLVLTPQNEWATAKHPLHPGENGNAGVGPGLDFAIKMLEDTDPKVRIGLIPTAVGGSGVDNWIPGGNLYSLSIGKALFAQTNGVIKGVLYLQGEANALGNTTNGWGNKVKLIIQGYRNELQDPNLKFLIGEIGRGFKGKESFALINNQIPGILQAVPNNTYLVSSEGLTDRGDALHFNSRSATQLGLRYAEQIKK